MNFGSLRSPNDVRALHSLHPETRLLVLANRPSPSECNQMLAFGATACLSKETQARDILNAIHLASRGLHVLPKTAREFGMTRGIALPLGGLACLWAWLHHPRKIRAGTLSLAIVLAIVKQCHGEQATVAQ